jgi:hypothetical protein
MEIASYFSQYLKIRFSQKNRIIFFLSILICFFLKKSVNLPPKN